MKRFAQLFPHSFLINISQNTSKQNLKTSTLVPNMPWVGFLKCFYMNGEA